MATKALTLRHFPLPLRTTSQPPLTHLPLLLRPYTTTTPPSPTSPAILLSTTTRSPTSRTATITISNPLKLNILTSSLFSSLLSTLHTASTTPHLRALILTGAGTKSFIGGADLRELSDLNPSSARAFASQIHAVCDAIRNVVPVPVIAAVNGHCYGAGLEIACAADLRLSASSAAFGMPEVRVGVPSVVEAALLPSLIGFGKTRRLTLLGEKISSRTAFRWGLVEKVVHDSNPEGGREALDGAVEEWVKLIEAGGAGAVRRQKRLVNLWQEGGVEEGIRAGVEAFGESYEGGEPREMMGEFFRGVEERRRAKGKGE